MVGLFKREVLSVEKTGDDQYTVMIKDVQDGANLKASYLNLSNMVLDLQKNVDEAPEFQEKRGLELLKQQQDIQTQIDALPTTMARKVAESKVQLANAIDLKGKFEPLAKPLVDAEPKLNEVAK